MRFFVSRIRKIKRIYFGREHYSRLTEIKPFYVVFDYELALREKQREELRPSSRSLHLTENGGTSLEHQ